MDLLEAIILGIVQGLTEFLPVSSSGHLEIVKALFGNEHLPKESMMFTVVLHFATALATIVVYRKDIAEILKGLISKGWNEDKSFSLKIILSMIPAAFVGVAFNDEIESFFEGNLLLVGFMLIVTALLLFLADRAKATEKDVTLIDSIVIGVAQAIAILPGISRSGATISTSVMLGIDKTKSARFSFLMVVPLILGKVAKDILDADDATGASAYAIDANIIVGFIVAFVTGVVACTWMIKLVRKSQLKYFSYYCVVVGLATLVYSFV